MTSFPPDCEAICPGLSITSGLFHCERHGCRKTKDWATLCQTRENYFLAWEQGYGPGQQQPMQPGKPARSRRQRRPPASAHPLILILGIHRTLSSCLATCLEKLGVFMGGDTKGGECQRLRYILEAVMRFPRTEPHVRCSDRGALRRWFAAHCELAGDRPIGAKYPHLCALAPEIARLAPLKIINLERPIEESIASLVDRSRKPGGLSATPEECERLQRYLDREKRRFLTVKDHLTVQAHDLLRYPARELNRVCEYLGLEPTAAQWQAAVDNVSPERAVHSAVARPPAWCAETTVCVKTFERPGCLDTCVRSIRRRYPSVPILVADDSREPVQRDDCTVVPMPFDSGLSAGRNLLVERATTPYVFMLDDDMDVGDARIEALWDELLRGDYDLVAGEITDNRRPVFAGHFEHAGDTLHIRPEPVPGSDPPLWHVVYNCFFARRAALVRVPWLDVLKVGEHIEWCIRAWKAGLRIGRVASVKISDPSSRPTKEYKALRNRSRSLQMEPMRQLARLLGFRHLIHHSAAASSLRNLF